MPAESPTRPPSQNTRAVRTARVSRFSVSRGRGFTPAFITRFERRPAPGATRDRIAAFMKAPTASRFLPALAGCVLLAGAAANYLNKLIKGAERDEADLIVLGISTPGGGLTSTHEMASAVLQSKVPVVTYVSPSG